LREQHRWLFARYAQAAVPLDPARVIARPASRAAHPAARRLSVYPGIRDAWALARRKAHRETGLELGTFPVECPFDLDGVLAEGWLPE
jgi:hypothetical protein